MRFALLQDLPAIGVRAVIFIFFRVVSQVLYSTDLEKTIGIRVRKRGKQNQELKPDNDMEFKGIVTRIWLFGAYLHHSRGQYEQY